MRFRVARASIVGFAVLLGLLAVGAAMPSGRPGPANPAIIEWPLACRLASYGKFQDTAWTHLPAIGVRYVFLSVPQPGDVDAVQRRLDEHHLRPLVMRGQADLGQPDSVAVLAIQLATCERMGVRYLFLSPRHSGVGKEVACERLRRAGEIARRHGVTIALESHPDLGTNADAHRETMRRINHPNVRVNFDTGNITYYNRNADVAAELAKVIDFVATVELKDHSGRYMTWDFPPLGQGKIDFAAVLRVLRDHGYTGPITIEVEGVAGESWDEARTKQAIADSVAFLRRLGGFK
jgi:inosose dehydratase